MRRPLAFSDRNIVADGLLPDACQLRHVVAILQSYAMAAMLLRHASVRPDRASADFADASLLRRIYNATALKRRHDSAFRRRQLAARIFYRLLPLKDMLAVYYTLHVFDALEESLMLRYFMRAYYATSG